MKPNIAALSPCEPEGQKGRQGDPECRSRERHSVTPDTADEGGNPHARESAHAAGKFPAAGARQPAHRLAHPRVSCPREHLDVRVDLGASLARASRRATPSGAIISRKRHVSPRTRDSSRHRAQNSPLQRRAAVGPRGDSVVAPAGLSVCVSFGATPLHLHTLKAG